VERAINQMQVLEELQVDCVTHVLIESAYSRWETIREEIGRGIEMEGLS
jgi:hypothetical protein